MKLLFKKPYHGIEGERYWKIDTITIVYFGEIKEMYIHSSKIMMKDTFNKASPLTTITSRDLVRSIFKAKLLKKDKGL